MDSEKWPNFFIVGTAKAGTTSFYEYLKQVPGIFMSNRKEPYFFVNEILHNDSRYPVSTKKEYLNLFKNVKNEKVVGEASLYLWYPESAKLIHEKIPNANILIILRDPIERAFSHHIMNMRDGKEQLPFHDFLLNHKSAIGEKNDSLPYYLKIGYYYDDVKRFIDVFGRKQVKIILFEEFVKKEKKIISEILQFLNIDYDISRLKIKKFNVSSEPRTRFTKFIINNYLISKIPISILSDSFKQKIKDNFLFKEIEKPRISVEDINLLYQFYREDVEKLQKLLKYKLPWFNEF